MSLRRHGEIYPSDEGHDLNRSCPAHRLDEFPAGYSWRHALQHGRFRFTSQRYAATTTKNRSMPKQRTANRGLAACLNPRVHCTPHLRSTRDRATA